MSDRGVLANALHQSGQLAKANARFAEAEVMQSERYPSHPLLSSIGSFLYCDLLLNWAERAAWTRMEKPVLLNQVSAMLNECREVSHRAATTLKWAIAQGSLLDTA